MFPKKFSRFKTNSHNSDTPQVRKSAISSKNGPKIRAAVQPEELFEYLENARNISRDEVLAILDSCTLALDEINSKIGDIVLGEFKFSGRDTDLMIVNKRMENTLESINLFIESLATDNK